MTEPTTWVWSGMYIYCTTHCDPKCHILSFLGVFQISFSDNHYMLGFLYACIIEYNLYACIYRFLIQTLLNVIYVFSFFFTLTALHYCGISNNTCYVLLMSWFDFHILNFIQGDNIGCGNESFYTYSTSQEQARRKQCFKCILSFVDLAISYSQDVLIYFIFC